MAEPVAGIVRVKTPRSVVARSALPVARTQAPSLLPLLIPASLAAAAVVGTLFGGKLFSRKKPPQNTAQVAMRVEVFALVLRSEK